jgi:hypothetical protein
MIVQCGLPLLFWLRRCRTNLVIAFLIALLILASLEEDKIVKFFTPPSSEFLH